MSSPAERSDRIPLVVALKRNATHDGPGIRTVVFFKGCPLTCSWCHNPEMIDPRPQLILDQDRCLRCGACVGMCPRRALGEGPLPRLLEERCDHCGQCVEGCPSGALSLFGRPLTCDELLTRVLTDTVFYAHSGGGVTVSGGEATLFPQFVGEFLRRCGQAGLHRTLQTCGHFGWAAFVEQVLPHLELIQFDLKLVDAARHLRATGHSNALILRNLRTLLAEARERVVVRRPLVPGINCDEADLVATGRLLTELGVEELVLLRYHRLWSSKAALVGRTGDPVSPSLLPPTDEALATWLAPLSWRWG